MPKLSSNRYKIQEFIIDCHKRTIESREQSIKLPVKVFEFLKLFLINENHTVERQQAIELIWQGNEGVGKRGYINAMWQIRKAFTDLGADSDEIFTTLPKVGYVLTVTPEAIATPGAKKLNIVIYLIVAVFLLVTCTLLFFYLVQSQEASRLPPQQSIAELKHQTNFQGVEEHPTISHDGNNLAFSWSQENKPAKIYVKDLTDKNRALRLISTGQYDEVSPTWSADDLSLAYIRLSKNNECQVRVKHLTSNEDRLIDSGCKYKPFLSILDWSSDGLNLIYPKTIDNTVAIFKYNFMSDNVTQVSFPQANTNDIMAIWSTNNEDIAIVRQTSQQFQVSLLNKFGDESVLIDNKKSITGLTWQGKDNSIYVTSLQNALYSIYKVDVDTKAKTQVRSVKGASNLSYNPLSDELFLAQHVLNEYIVQHSLIDQRIIRRVSSSSRNMYGAYVPKTANIIFTSNRSENWDLWLKSAEGTKNITSGLGAVATSAVSPDSKSFAVTLIKPNENQKMFLGSFDDGKLTQLETGELLPEYPSWSVDSKRIYFSAKTDNKSGIYQYEVETGEVTQLTNTGEAYAVEGSDGELYVTRYQANGIWRFEQTNRQFTKIIHELSVVDFAGFFWENDTIYYISRTKENDFVKKYLTDSQDEIVVTYPKNSIRKYKGISKAEDESFLITLRSIYDADIFSISVN